MFLTGGGPKIELLESLPDEETLNHGCVTARVYHMKYEVDNIKIAADFSKTYTEIVSPPVSLILGSKFVSSCLETIFC